MLITLIKIYNKTRFKTTAKTTENDKEISFQMIDVTVLHFNKNKYVEVPSGVR